MKLLNSAQLSLVSGGFTAEEAQQYAFDTMKPYVDKAQKIIQKEWAETTTEQLVVSGLIGVFAMAKGNPHAPLLLRAAVVLPIWYITCMFKHEPYKIF